MIRPDIKTYHEDWGSHLQRGRWHRDHFLGRSPRDFYDHQMPANISKDGTLFEIKLALPGFQRDEIEVSIEDNELTITAQKTHQEVPRNRYIVQEFDIDTVQRKFELANIVSHDKIKAEFNNGILKLKFEDYCEVNGEDKKRISVK